MKSLQRSLLVALFTCGSPVLAQQSAAPDAAVSPVTPNAMVSSGAAAIIVDGTASMSGKIKGGRKLQAAVESISNAIAIAAPDIGLLVLGYGSEPKRRCEDVSTLSAFTTAGEAKAATGDSLRKLAPKPGRTAQIAAINRAAETLATQSPGARSRIVLLADGADDCAEDPCAAASAFHRKYPSVAVHVVALAVPAAAKPKLRCLSQSTGGRFADIADRAAVLPAITEAMAADQDILPPVEAQPTVTADKPTPDAVPPSPGEPQMQAQAASDGPAVPPLPERSPGPPPEPNVLLRAVMGEGSPALEQGVGWRVYSQTKGAAGSAEDYRKLTPIWTGSGAEPRFRLNPGEYRVEASYGFAVTEKDMTVPASGKVDFTLVLNAGTIMASARAEAGGAMLDDAFFTVSARQPNGTWRETGRSSKAEAVFHVPAGDYKLVAEHGRTTGETTVTVRAGETLPATVVLNTGTLRLEARAKTDAPVLQDVFYTVFTAGKEGESREVARSSAQTPAFPLASGQYRVIAQYDLARVERDVTVSAGTENREQIILDGGRLAITAKVSGRPDASAKDLDVRVFRMDGAAEQPYTPIAPYLTLGREVYVQGGRYRVESRYGGHNAVETADIYVSGGETRTVMLEHKCAEIKLSAADKPGGRVLTNAKWTIRDAAGAVVLTTSEPTPSPILKAGKYEASAEHDNRTGTLAFDVPESGAKAVEVVLK